MNFKALRLIARRYALPVPRRMRYADGKQVVDHLRGLHERATHYLIESGNFLQVDGVAVYVLSDSGYWSRLSTESDVIYALPDSKILTLRE